MNFIDTKKLNFLLEEHKTKFLLVILLFLISSALEFVSLSLMVPFMDYIFNVGDNESSIFKEIVNIFDLSKISLLYLLIITFSIRYVLILYINYKIPKIAYDHQKNLRFKIIQSYMMSFEHNLSSSNLIQLSTATLSIFTVQFLMSMMKMISNFIIILFILIFLIFFNPKGTFVLLSFLFVFYLFYKIYFKKKFKLLGDSVILNNSNVIDITNEIFKGLQEIKIYKKSRIFLNKIEKFGIELSRSETFLRFLVPLPRIILEMLIVFSFLLLVFIFYIYEADIPVLSFLVYGYAALRILPPISEFITSINVCRSATKSLSDIYFFLKKNKTKNKYVNFKINKFDSLKIKNLKFGYNNSNKYLFKNLNFEINKGDFFGIFGDSGVGKSTLLKIILGIQKIEIGKILLNNSKSNFSSFYEVASYLPQDNFIFKGTIKENISLNDDCTKEDEIKIWDMLKQVKLLDKVNQLQGKLNFKLAENGRNLSGGQKQRISIARALYHNRQVIFLDESTSSLDSESEKLILDLLKKNKSLTKILITHKKKLLENCNKVLVLSKNNSKLIKQK